MARLVRGRNPSLWDAVMATSAKHSAIDVLRSNDGLALVECRYARHNVIPVTWCGQNPTSVAQVGVFDLRHDPADFMSLSSQELVDAIKVPKSPLRIVQANAQPILIPLCRAATDVIKDPPSAPPRLPDEGDPTKHVVPAQGRGCYRRPLSEKVALAVH